MKSHDIRNFISSHDMKLLSLLVTRVKNPKLGELYSILCLGWCFTHNNSHHSNGIIIVGW